MVKQSGSDKEWGLKNSKLHQKTNIKRACGEGNYTTSFKYYNLVAQIVPGLPNEQSSHWSTQQGTRTPDILVLSRWDESKTNILQSLMIWKNTNSEFLEFMCQQLDNFAKWSFLYLHEVTSAFESPMCSTCVLMHKIITNTIPTLGQPFIPSCYHITFVAHNKFSHSG